MPITKSAKKELRKSKKQALVNRIQKKNIKETIKKIHKAIDGKNAEEAQKLALDVVKLLDKAAKRRLVHKNVAARKKSRVYKAIKKASSSK
ncbi:30S ribosomal protein S20 [bacterium]|jgi:small subunit ribosomal protein S20|nr:30S ribosomal protein S20 [bacterium]MDP6571314.1 30S ribosomal protein S20 [Patescibacteria group bacterium]MDP6756332.1 30S ribosomal protein S20 [Patescibacteria group bacterium]|tara:strand:- start:29153 stop:29425 length:273 start_codon:yes stop_codon:yes gene_type:complete